MVGVDYLVILMYVLGLVGVGLFFTLRVRDASDMFAAGGQSPWWMAGLSGFMTMFSAGTFVVWGGIAYKHGMVAVAISLCYGVAALVVGWTVAGYWRRLGVSSAAEFLQLRYGRSIVQFYTWLHGTLGMFGMGGAIYALAVIICALVPLPAGHVLADAHTGRLSVTWTSIAISVMVVLITFGGGLWAVLMTDVLQFIVLTVSVVFVVPLCFMAVGGVGAFIDAAPAGFFSPVAVDYSWWFLAGWVVVHYFKIGGEWAFVQRYTCVPSPADARKSAYIFGVMYLVSPLFWMLPPMIYRTVNPNADAEQTYILACRQVLPPGMVGLMVAAMMSATASMATTQLNVYAGAFTTEVYQKLLRPTATATQIVRVGRILTVVLGGLIAAGAILIPVLGTYTNWILATTAMLTGPLVLPTIWGLFSRKIGLRDVWAVTVLGFVAAMLVKFGLNTGGWLDGVTWLTPIAQLVQANIRVTDLTIGIVVPSVALAILELLPRREHPGWARVQLQRHAAKGAPVVAAASTLPAKICGWTVALLAMLMATLAYLDEGQRATMILGLFAALLFIVAAAILLLSMRVDRIYPALSPQQAEA